MMTKTDMAKISKRLEEGLSAAWRLRMDQKLPECRTSFYQLLKKLKVDPALFEVNYLLNVDQEHLSIFTDAFLLQISLLRSEGKIQEAIDALQSLEGILKKRHFPFPFHLFFQKGNNHLYKGDFTEALELFVQASSIANTNEEKVIALSNTLYCLENLGQSFSTVLSDLKERLKTIPVDELSGVKTQFTTLEQRHSFREGDFKSFFDCGAKVHEGQVAYLRFWASELPYHTFYQSISDKEKEDYYTKTPNLFQKSYRTRTLQGIIHASDFEKRFRESDFADRLYLWTWRWLVSPESFSFEKIVILLENIELRELLPRLTAEDFCLVRNALLWIAFFVPRYSEELERMAKHLKQPVTCNYPLFDFEKQVVDYYKAKQQKNDEAEILLEKLQKNPLWKSQNLGLADFNLPQLQGLKNRIELLLNQVDNFKKGVVYVDMGRRELIWDGGRQRLISEPACLAIDLMKRKECLTFEEFLGTCFGIHRFDSIIHNAKVYNLIARLKEILGKSISIKTKYARIYAFGDWDTVSFFYPSLGLENVLRRTDLGQIFKRGRQHMDQSPSRAFRPAIVLAGKKDANMLSRQELEAAIGKSRATANRIIQNWVEQGIVKKIGKAKNTKYLVLTQSSQLPTEI